MPLLPNEVPPEETNITLKEYLSRMFNITSIAITKQDKINRYGVIPNKLAIGKLYYFNLAIAGTGITQEGLYVYKSTGWSYLG